MHTVGGPKGVEEVERLFPLPSWIRAKNGRSPFVSQRTPRTERKAEAERQAHKLDSSLLVPRGQYLLVFSIMRRTDRVNRIDFIQSSERRRYFLLFHCLDMYNEVAQQKVYKDRR